MEAPSLEQCRTACRNRYARVILVLLGAVLAVGAWQSYGVLLLYGIEGSYDR